ncbi:unnamed protein product [Lactuca saligna]|uniref:Uncharacterized protein n=1 Tax=Lactuca saligna TaxID=75948 RepID=A0AA35ZLU6_LACSI|nr:unnamed protein product [Lactuca saligna]
MAGDHRYVMAQASALMVVVADWVFHASVNEKQLITLQAAMASIREELHNSEAEQRLESQVSSLTQEKGLLASELTWCQHQLARAHVDGAIARGNLQWMLEKGVVHVINKVIESVEFVIGIQGVHMVCEALGFEKGKQLCWGFLSFPPPGPSVRELNSTIPALEVHALSLLPNQVCVIVMGSISPQLGLRVRKSGTLPLVLVLPVFLFLIPWDFGSCLTSAQVSFKSRIAFQLGKAQPSIVGQIRALTCPHLFAFSWTHGSALVLLQVSIMDLPHSDNYRFDKVEFFALYLDEHRVHYLDWLPLSLMIHHSY